jgi:ribosomal-protein-alanine N-acetyltransferase
VHPAARRRGLGRALLERCEHDALELGKGALILQVTTDNQPAIRLYREFGFEVRSRRRWRLRRRLFGSPGSLIMEKSLS